MGCGDTVFPPMAVPVTLALPFVYGPKLPPAGYVWGGAIGKYPVNVEPFALIVTGIVTGMRLFGGVVMGATGVAGALGICVGSN